MELISKEKALDLLEKTISEGARLQQGHQDRERWQTWERDATVRIRTIFGSESSPWHEIMPLINEMKELDSPLSKKNVVGRVLAMLRSFYSEVQDIWTDRGTQDDVDTSSEMPENEAGRDSASNKVFVVHGHDHTRMQALTRWLEDLELMPIVLHEQPSRGDTIVEKLESHDKVAFAVVLLTPDDVGAMKKDRDDLQPRARQNMVFELGHFIARLGRRRTRALDDLQPRARQNVVLELGYFMAKLGRIRTRALVVEGVEIPSDYSGVVYIKIDREDAWKHKLARELKAAGLPIDMNKIV